MFHAGDVTAPLGPAQEGRASSFGELVAGKTPNAERNIGSNIGWCFCGGMFSNPVAAYDTVVGFHLIILLEAGGRTRGDF